LTFENCWDEGKEVISMKAFSWGSALQGCEQILFFLIARSNTRTNGITIFSLPRGKST
jgi:hypothetical protein